MRIACFADLHVHTFKDFDEPSDTSGSQRLDNILNSVEFIRDYCYKTGIRKVLFAGDAFHTRGKVDTLAFNSLYDVLGTFNDKDIQIVMIAGNHDQKDNSSLPTHSLYTFDKLPGVEVFGDLGSTYMVEIDEYEDSRDTVEIVCVPYNKDAQRIKEYINEVTKESSPHPRILLAHLGISGAKVGKNSYPMAEAFSISDLKPGYFKYVVLGHFHKRQFLNGCNHAFYCGSPIQHNFNDEGDDKGFYVIDTNKRWDVQFVPIPNPKFCTLNLPVDTKVLEDLANSGDYVRVLATEDNLMDFENIVPQNMKYKVELQRVYEEQTRVDVKVGMGFNEIIEKYANEFNPEAKEIGLKILSEVEGNQ